MKKIGTLWDMFLDLSILESWVLLDFIQSIDGVEMTAPYM